MSHQKFVNVYNDFRTIALNHEYYGHKVASQRRRLRRLDVALAAIATVTMLASAKYWNETLLGYPVAALALGALGALAVVAAAIRPYFKLEDDLERYSVMQGAYASLFHVMEDVVTRVKTTESVDETAEELRKVLRQIQGSFSQKEDAPQDSKLAKEVQQMINERYPEGYFYYPGGE